MEKYIILILGALLHVTLAKDGVPVLMWSNDGMTSRLPIPLAGHTIEAPSFKRDYLDLVMPCKGCDGHNVVVFMKEMLSLEDMTKFGDVYDQTGDGGSFHNVKSYMDKPDSLAISSAARMPENIEYLKLLFGDNVHVLDTLSEVERVPFDNKSRLVVVHLVEDHSLPLEKRLASQDELIGSIVKNLEKRGVVYTALFTAERPSHQDQPDDVMSSWSRHLLAAEESKPVAVNVSDCFLMYYTQLTLASSDGKNASSPGIPITAAPTTTGSTCEKDTATIVLQYGVTGQKVSSLTLKMVIKMSQYQDWAVQTATVSVDKQQEVQLDATAVYAPLKFSYACGQTILSTNSSQTQANKVQLNITGFQIQAFALNNGKFGYPNDCTPFFSIGILSGLIVSFILLAILSFGIIMVANITTMDRFDDPKGAQLNINVQDKN